MRVVLSLVSLLLVCQCSASALVKEAEIHIDDSVSIGGLSSPIPENAPITLKGPIVGNPQYTSLAHLVERGSVRLKRGSRFAVILLSPVGSQSSKIGDPIKAMVLTCLRLNEKVLVPAGSYLEGWVSSLYSERSVLKSKFSSTRWRNSHAALSLHFDKLILPDKRVIHVSVEPAANTPLSLVTGEDQLVVNETHEIQIDFNGAKYGAAGVAIQAASWATGPFKFVVAPVLSGAAGAVSPEYALDRPVKDPENNRIRGLLNGVVKGLPGGGIALGAKHKGVSINLYRGVELQVELSEDLVFSL